MKNRAQTIVIFAQSTVPFKSGAGVNAFNLAKECHRQDLNVSIISFGVGKQPFREKLENIQIIRLPVITKSLIGKLWSYAIISPMFIYFLARSNLAIIFGPLQGYIQLIIVGRLIGKKVLFRSTMLGVDDLKSLTGKYGKSLCFIRRYLLGFMGGYISQSPAMTASLKHEFGKSVPFFESAQGVDTKVFYPISQATKLDLRNKLNLPVSKHCSIIISVGYVIERKGLRAVFDSLEQLNIEKFLYLVVGDFALEPDHYLYKSRDEMEALHYHGIKQLNEKVFFTGRVENTHEYLQASDIFILNSKVEGMPNVLLEAMACGLPSIVNRLDGVNNFITFNGVNSLVIENDETLLNAIKELIQNKDLSERLGNEAAKTITDGYSLEHVAGQIINRFI